MRQHLTIDFVTEFLPERIAILQQLNGVRMTSAVHNGLISEPGIELDRDINGYSSGEHMVIRFVQTPTRPLDLSILSGEVARRALDLHTKFWSKRLGV